jgi:HEAT repeat protein
MPDLSAPAPHKRRLFWLLTTAVVLWLLLVLCALTWWLLPRLAPKLVTLHVPFPGMVIRTVTEGKASANVARQSLINLGPAAVDELVEALQHENRTVRWMALTALGEIKDRRATSAIVAFLDAPGVDFQTEALKALVLLQDPVAIPCLIGHLSKGSDRENAARALAAIAHNGADTAVADAAIQIINDQQQIALQLYPVFWLLSQNGDPRVPGWLDTVLRSPLQTRQSDVDLNFRRSYAAHALAFNQQPHGRELHLLALRDPSSEIRKAGVKGSHAFIGRLPRPQVNRDMLEAVAALLDDPEPEVVTTAVRFCLGQPSSENYLSKVIALMTNSAAPMRAAAANGIEYVSNADGQVALADALTQQLWKLANDPDAVVRRATIQAVSYLQEQRSSENTHLIVLLKAIQDASPGVRLAATRGLKYTNDQDAITALVRALDDADADVAKAALRTLLSTLETLSEEQKQKMEARKTLLGK